MTGTGGIFRESEIRLSLLFQRQDSFVRTGSADRPEGFPERGEKRQQGENLEQGKQMDEQDSKSKEDKAKERRTGKEQNAEPQGRCAVTASSQQIKLNSPFQNITQIKLRSVAFTSQYSPCLDPTPVRRLKISPFLPVSIPTFYHRGVL
jgi:hypothetical protein